MNWDAWNDPPESEPMECPDDVFDPLADSDVPLGNWSGARDEPEEEFDDSV